MKRIITNLERSCLMVIVSWHVLFFPIEAAGEGVPFPQLADARKLFAEREEHFEAMYAELNTDSTIKKLICVKGPVRVQFPGELFEEEAPPEVHQKYRPLCDNLGLALIWRIEDGMLFYGAGEEADDKSFHISFIRVNDPNLFQPDCKTLDSFPPRGTCVISLNENWVLEYDWVTLQSSSENQDRRSN